MPTLPYRIYDADNHYYEPDDCFTRHIEAPFRERSVRIDRSQPGPGLRARPEPFAPPRCDVRGEE